jgi:hypothetical protein
MREAQNNATRAACQAQDFIDKEDQGLEEQETIIAAKARTDGARVGREFNRKRFKVNAVLSES